MTADKKYVTLADITAVLAKHQLPQHPDVAVHGGVGVTALIPLAFPERTHPPVPSGEIGDLFGIPVVEDATLPPLTWEIRDRDGTVLQRGRIRLGVTTEGTDGR